MKPREFFVRFLLAGTASVCGEAINHGVPAPVSNSRGALATADRDGRPIILAMTMNRPFGQRRVGVLLLIDALTGAVDEVPYPEKAPAGRSNFGVMVASSGRLYTGFGPLLAEFDPDQKAFTWHTLLDPDPGHALAWAEDADGIIYAGYFNSCTVFALDPRTRGVRNLGRLDPNEKFIYHLHTDDAGWLYAAIGNTRSNLVGLHLQTGERRQLIPDSVRTVGTAVLRRGRDGKLYGRSGPQATHWLRLHDGEAEPVDQTPEAVSVPAIAWQRVYSHFPDGTRLLDFDLPNTSYSLVSPEGIRTDMTFEHIGSGARITAMKGAPDGRVYGSTSHPFRMFAVNAETGERTDYGGLRRVGSGNVRGLVWHEGTLYGADYSRGQFWAFDTTASWNDTGGEDANPRVLGAYAADLGRPRTMILHPDNRTIIWSGMAGYGHQFGGMGFYDTRTGEIALLKNERLVPELSCITLRAMPDGTLVGATTVTAGFGHDATRTEAEIFLMDADTRSVTFSMVPLPGARSIWCVEVGADGLVYGITPQADLFTFDPETKNVKSRLSLAEYGSVPGPDQALFRHGNRVHALLGNALLEVREQGDSLQARKVRDLPSAATAGTGVVAGRVFYASDTEVWSIPLPPD